MEKVKDKVRVLVIDDLADARLLLETLFEHAGAEVLCVASGNEALSAIEIAEKSQRQFHLISTDIRMPELNGIDTTAQIRTAGYKGAIVAFTATVNLLDKDKGKKNGINKYFSKTQINRDVIGAIVEQVKIGELL
jgi:CheY-like chemotaxis protein